MKRIVLIPIGSLEQHGPHLPPNTDYLIATATCEGVKKDVNVEIDEGILISHSPEHQDFKETKSLTKEEFINKVLDKLTFHEENKLIILVNAHGGNSEILKNLEKEMPHRFFLFDIFKKMKKHFNKIRTSEIGGICHAGEFETSLMLFLYPNLVDLNKVTIEQIKLVPELDPSSKGPRQKNWKTINLNRFGILGDPLKASKEKGEKWFQFLISEIISILEI